MPWNKASSTRELGNITEHFAEQYLVHQGLTLIDKNVYCRQGEIDLIMQDGETLVFIEVKYRKNNHYGGAIAAISAAKQKKLKHYKNKPYKKLLLQKLKKLPIKYHKIQKICIFS